MKDEYKFINSFNKKYSYYGDKFFIGYRGFYNDLGRMNQICIDISRLFRNEEFAYDDLKLRARKSEYDDTFIYEVYYFMNAVETANSIISGINTMVIENIDKYHEMRDMQFPDYDKLLIPVGFSESTREYQKDHNRFRKNVYGNIRRGNIGKAVAKIINDNIVLDDKAKELYDQNEYFRKLHDFICIYKDDAILCKTYSKDDIDEERIYFAKNLEAAEYSAMQLFDLFRSAFMDKTVPPRLNSYESNHAYLYLHDLDYVRVFYEEINHLIDTIFIVRFNLTDFYTKNFDPNCTSFRTLRNGYHDVLVDRVRDSVKNGFMRAMLLKRKRNIVKQNESEKDTNEQSEAKE